jgi:hypothetical protein
LDPPLRRLPAPDTLPYLLLTLTAISGEFPVSQVNRLPGGASYKKSVVTSLKRENLLRTYYRDSLRGLRLTAVAKKRLLADQPEWFARYLTGNSETNTLKSEVTRRLRLHRMAEVLVTMLNADVPIFFWEKQPLFQQQVFPLKREPVQCPVYYSSREIKELGPQAIKVKGSRTTGVLLTDAGIFMVYNTGDTLMKWEYKAEMRLKALLQTELCQRRLPAQFASAEINGIIFGCDMEPLARMFVAEHDAKHNYFVLDGNLAHFYYLPSDHRGEVMLRLLYEPALRSALDNVLSEDLYAGRPGWLVENDAMDGAGEPVLFAYTCDLPRIRRFDTALELQGRTGTLICFDFQEETLRRACGSHITFQSIDFEKFERSMLYPPKRPD